MPPIPKLLLLSAACSRRTGILSALPSANLIAYASANNIILISAALHKPLCATPAHTAQVTAVSLLHLPCSAHILLFAASADGSVAVWRCQDSLRYNQWTPVARFRAHQSQPCVALTVSAFPLPYMVTAGMEGGLRLWKADETGAKWSNVADSAVSDSDTVLLEVVAMRPLGTECAVVAAAGTNRRVWLFSVTFGHAPFLQQVAVLNGHRDWVRGLAFSPDVDAADGEGCAFFFASASKDGTARVWRVEKDTRADDDMFDLHTARVKASFGGCTWSFASIGLLDEHTAAVHSVAFSEVTNNQMPMLLTSSMDCSVALWGIQQARWQCVARFGLMGGTSAHALGFFGAIFTSRDGSEVLGHNFAGALHCWQAEKSRFVEGCSTSMIEMLARSAPGGHFAAVTDLSWEPNGRYLLSCSVDKTARIFAEVDEEGERRFVEWARPQIHGHAMFVVAFCDEDGGRYVSGAEERMLRMFQAPSSFVMPGKSSSFLHDNGGQKAVAAVMPELGLSNKATFQLEADDQPGADSAVTDGTKYEDVVISSFGASRGESVIPLEEELKQKRLWPETAKLYGHGNEISCVAVDLKRNLLSSCCRAQSAKDAVIILWDVNSGIECGRLFVHDLTVNEMRFSSDGNALASISRDRSYAIFRRRDPENRFSLELEVHKKAAHSRLIYCCTWILEDTFIATGGRDKYLKIFAAEKTKSYELGEEVFKQKFTTGVSAVDGISPPGQEQSAVLAAGFENGDILLFVVEKCNDTNAITVRPLFSTSSETKCGGRVNRLQWRPGARREDNGMTKLQIGIASEDMSVRVLEFDVELGKR